MRATRLWRQQQKQLLQACAALNGACPVASVPIATSAWQQAAHTQACIRIQSSLSGVPSRCEHAMEHAHDTCIRRFATSAEFSGGVFTENSEKSSTQHLDDQEPDDKLMLLEAALGFVKERGWTRASLVAGAQHIGMSPAIIGLLPRGSAELLEYHIEKCNLEFSELLQSRQSSWQQLRTMQRIREGTKLRLEMNIPYIDTWAQALSIQSQPRNAPKALRQLAQVTDDIWHAAGDKSTDYNWYTKRGLLASVYTATELYMLTDYSPGYADTWEVLDRRLDDVMKLGKLMGQTKKSAASFVEQIQNSLFKQHTSRAGSSSS